jgi:outer membrane translocation and assembly module TamA
MAIKQFIDKLTGKTKREEEERLRIAAEEEKALKRAEARAKKEAKKAEEAAKKNDPKARATAAGEPWVNVLGIEVDPENPGAGAFELDWNDVFVARLIKSGYQGKTDADVVDNWFQDVCRNVVLETYQQEQADPVNRQSKRKDLGNGRAEIS